MSVPRYGLPSPRVTNLIVVIYGWSLIDKRPGLFIVPLTIILSISNWSVNTLTPLELEMKLDEGSAIL